jgi:hypothetical protein
MNIVDGQCRLCARPKAQCFCNESEKELYKDLCRQGNRIAELQSDNEQLNSNFRTLEYNYEQSIREREDLEHQVEQLKVKQEASDMQERMVLTKMAEIAEYESVEQMLKCAPFMSDGQEREMQNLRLFVEAMLNEREQLKKQLEGAIVPKFKIGQEVWYFFEQELRTDFIKKYHINTGTMIRYNLSNGYFGNIYKERDLFATREEAEASLKQKEGE